MSNNKTTKSIKHQPVVRAVGVIWDIPLRVFHWALVLSVIGAIGSAKNGFMFWHEKMGLCIAGLVLFRIIWGFIGSHHARFQHFLVGPGAAMRYLRLRWQGNRDHMPGHAPTGGYATIIILAVLLVMAGLGTMAHDDVLYEGPLAAYVGAFSNDARSYHHLMEKAVFALIGLHLAAMAVYRIGLKINLIPAMVHGGRDEDVPSISNRRQWAGVGLMVVMVVAAQALGLLGDRFY